MRDYFSRRNIVLWKKTSKSHREKKMAGILDGWLYVVVSGVIMFSSHALFADSIAFEGII